MHISSYFCSAAAAAAAATSLQIVPAQCQRKHWRSHLYVNDMLMIYLTSLAPDAMETAVSSAVF